MFVTPLPRMDSREALQLMLLQQKLVGINVDENPQVDRITSPSGEGWLYRKAFGDQVMGCAVFATKHNTITIHVTSHITAGDMPSEAMRAVRGLHAIGLGELSK